MKALFKQFLITMIAKRNTDDDSEAWDALTILADGAEITGVTCSVPAWEFYRAVPVPPEMGGEEVEDEALFKQFRITMIASDNTDDDLVAWDNLAVLADGAEITDATCSVSAWSFYGAVPVPPEMGGEEVEDDPHHPY